MFSEISTAFLKYSSASSCSSYTKWQVAIWLSMFPYSADSFFSGKLISIRTYAFL